MASLCLSVPEGGSLSDCHSASSLGPSLWSSSYPSQTASCLSTVHPDFPGGAAFHAADTAGVWSGHGFPQLSLSPAAAAGLPDSWHYGLSAQGGAAYPSHVHELYSHHVHPRHAHPHNHSHPHVLPHGHGPSLEPCFSPLLLHAARPSCSPVSHADVAKADLEARTTQPSSWPTSFHGSVDVFETGRCRSPLLLQLQSFAMCLLRFGGEL